MALWDWSLTEPRWSFVVDTDLYAGNFERELSSYVVGACDESGEHRGGPYAEMYRKDFCGRDPFKVLVDMRVDDHGDDSIMRSPMALAPTPGYGNDGRGGAQKVRAGKKAKHPSYQSVAIFLRRRPTDRELASLAERARRFGSLPKVREFDARPKILGCRLVEESVVLKSTDIP